MAQQQRLTPGARVDDVPAIADSVVALHCSDPVSMYLSAAARMKSPSIAATERALHEERSVVRHHGMRRTLWVYTPATARIAHGATTLDIAAAEWKQLRKWVAASDIPDPDVWLETMRAAALAALHRMGPISARRLGKAAPELTTKIETGAGKYATQQALHTRLLLNLGFDATIVRSASTGSWLSGEYEWSVMADWLGQELVGHDPLTARRDLAARYLHAFGPATATDLQWWAGWTVAATKAAIAAAGAVEVQLDDGTIGWLLEADLENSQLADDTPWVALLPGLDPTTMGWKHREWYLGEWNTFGGPLFDKNGNAGPTVWVNGEVVGSWAQRPDGSVVYELLQPVDSASRREIETTAEQLRVVIGAARVTPRFPTPLQKSLAVG